MKDTSLSNSNRIAKNTVFLYIRMLFLMVVSLYTSRVILANLGITDFGIYNVIGGLATMFVFFRSSLANVTQRYLSIELGKEDIKAARNIFCVHQSVYIVISLAVLVLGEVLGTWFIYNKLNIPPNRLNAAFWVFQFTLVSLCTTIISVVYEAVLIAREEMSIYAYVGVIEGCLKLVIAFAIAIIPYDKLITYSFLLVLVAIGIRVFYSFFCSRKYVESVYNWQWNKDQIKECSSMIGWNTIGTLVYTINEQGLNILLNLFFGPIVNAARGIAGQVSQTVNNFGANFYTSVRPQLVKSYASSDFNYLFKLFFSTSKLSVYLLWIIALPLCLSIDMVLRLWLKVVPEYTNIFTVLILVYSVINVLNTPIWALALAIGRLKKYILYGSAVFLMTFPIAYLFLKWGYPPQSVFVVGIIVRCLYIYTVLIVVKQEISISIRRYFMDVICPISYVILISGGFCIWANSFFDNSIIQRFSLSVLSFISVGTVIFTVGLKRDERVKILSMVRNKLRKNGN